MLLHTCVALPNSYASIAAMTAAVVADSLLSSQRHASGSWRALMAALGAKSSPRFFMANLMAFQSLLHQCR